MLILSAVGALLVLLLTAAGAMALTGIVPTAGLLGEEEGSSAPESADSSQPSSESTNTAASVSPDSPPDPAFEKLLPTLVQKTRVPIMLPADLPEELNNVAIDGGFRGNGYGISFLRNPSDNVVERPPIEVFGYLQTSPKSETKSGGYFEAASVETVTLPDGTEATLRQMRPIANKGSEDQFWEGKFDLR